MFATGSNKTIKKSSNKLGYGIAAIVASCILAGTVAVSAQTSGSDSVAPAPALLAQSTQEARPLNIGLRGVSSARKVRVIQIYNVSADQQKFGAR